MTALTTDRWRLARHRLRADAAATTWLWAIVLVATHLIVLVVFAVRGSIEVSGWEVASQLARWYAGGLGVYLAAVYLPLYVAHGYTRREIARQLPVAAVGTVLLLAVLMTVGYAVERAVYAVAGWPQVLGQEHLFDSVTAYPVVTAEFLVLFLVWTAAGAMVGAAIYRQPGAGIVAIPAGVVVVAAVEAVANPVVFDVAGMLGRLVGVDVAPTTIGMAVLVAAACLAVTLPVTWLVVRDVPMRPQNV